MNDRNNHNNEVDLLIFFSAVIKRKKMILSVFFIFIIIATILVFLKPNLYLVSQILKPPAAGINESLVTLKEIEEKIQEGIYDHKINEKLELYPIRNFDFDTTASAIGNFIKVNLLVKEKDLDLGPKILNNLFLVLKSEYQPKVKAENVKIENEINLLKNEISKIELKKEKINRDIQIKFIDIEDRRDEKNSLSNKIKLAEERRVILLEKLKYAKETNDINQLNNQLNSLEAELEQLLFRMETIDTTIKRIEIEIADLKSKKPKEFDIEIERILIEINKLEAGKQFISNFVQLKLPVSSLYLTETNKIRKIAAAGMIGLAIGVFLAFFVEFWQKAKTIKGYIVKDKNNE